MDSRHYIKLMKDSTDKRHTTEFIQLIVLEKKINRELSSIRKGLKHIQSMCGNPDAAEGCRLIIKKCEELLGDI